MNKQRSRLILASGVLVAAAAAYFISTDNQVKRFGKKVKDKTSLVKTDKQYKKEIDLYGFI